MVSSTKPATRVNTWMANKIRAGDNTHTPEGQLVAWGETFWGAPVRERLAMQVESIRHWKLIEGSYTKAPQRIATWFIDPPYEKAGKSYRYGSRQLDFDRLANWCRSRRGLAIVCEQRGATWLPFVRLAESKALRGVTREVAFIRRTSRQLPDKTSLR